MIDQPAPSRVTHPRYGRGRFETILPTLGKSQARVRFDGETASRRVWLADLAPEPASMANIAEPRTAVPSSPNTAA